jgi:hypothetical protein
VVLSSHGQEGFPALMPGDLDMWQIVEAGPAQGAVAHVETSRPNDIHGNAETRREAQDGSCILWNVRLVEREAHLSHDVPSHSFARLRVRQIALQGSFKAA